MARHLWDDARKDGISAEERQARLKAAAARNQRALVGSPRLAEALALRRELIGAGIASAENPSEDSLPTDPGQLHEMVLELRPSFAEELLWWARWLDGQGRESEAETARAAARRLDPAGLVE
jgi:hypothetical protein